MRIATVGKGGSGKTTIASLLIQILMQQDRTILAIDADINQTLAAVLDLPADSLPALGSDQDVLKHYVRGTRAIEESHIVKTTLPGPGARLLSLKESNPVFDHYAYRAGGLLFLQVGGFQGGDIGTHCYHSKTGAVELLLNHLMDMRDEYVVVDMTAGADAFASGLFTRFDLTLLVVEPTMQSVSVYNQYKAYAAEYGLAIRVIGNKVSDVQDEEFIRRHAGGDLIGCLRSSAMVKARDRGAPVHINMLEPANRAVLNDVISVLCAQTRNWPRYWDQAIAFHLKNAESWANAYTGTDLSTQIQREYLKTLVA